MRDEKNQRDGAGRLSPAGKKAVARDLITNAEAQLRRTLTDGERRDLLMDNTQWSRRVIAGIVESMHSATQAPSVSRETPAVATRSIQAVLEALRNSQTTVDATTGHRAIKALAVIVLTPHIKEYLQDHDPQALRQAVQAILEVSVPPTRQPSPEPTAIQTSCRYCQQDIEGFSGSNDWRDRGNNTQCPGRSGRKHDPYHIPEGFIGETLTRCQMSKRYVPETGSPDRPTGTIDDKPAAPEDDIEEARRTR